MNKQRTPLIAGNWKMFHGGLSGIELAHRVGELAKTLPHVDLLIAPPFTALAACSSELDGSPVRIAAQNMHAQDNGAFTGEISAPMLQESGVSWVLLGHSERRQIFGETDALVAEKVRAAITRKISPIVCVGETLAEREAGATLSVIGRQLAACLSLLVETELDCAIAYEPVWAIGTGKNAGPKEAEEAHAFLRQEIAKMSPARSDQIRLLYGGSLKPENAESLLGCPNVDGGLIGGASLEIGTFGGIAKAAETLRLRLHS